ncbi:MAG: hypothetical protein J07HX64_00143 [halophilic archaeon J07HX64]|nr:MAG: hypothetical protein J07HX64_00143 [halophilic archaeon J07HX64]
MRNRRAGAVSRTADSALVAYVEAFERALSTHEVVCGARESSSYVTNAFVSIHRTGGTGPVRGPHGGVLTPERGATSGVDLEGGPWEAGAAPPEGVVYAVEAPGADRVAFDTE